MSIRPVIGYSDPVKCTSMAHSIQSFTMARDIESEVKSGVSSLASTKDASRDGMLGTYCIVCAKSIYRETWESHSKTSAHMVNADRFDWIFATEKSGVLRCNICGSSVGWDEIWEHEKQHFSIPCDKMEDKYDKYQIFFENSITEWREAYRCNACELTFSEWSTALVHVVDGEHQARIAQSNQRLCDLSAQGGLSYELLVKEGLVATDAVSDLECKICKVRNVLLENVLRHVKGLAHVSNRSCFAFEPTDSCKEETVTEETPDMEAGEPWSLPALCDYVVKKNYRIYRCVICNCDLDATSKTQHLMSLEHAASLKRTRCDAVTMTNGREFFCKLCDCRIVGLSDVYEHVQKRKHRAAAEASWMNKEDTEFKDIWLVHSNEDFSRCVVCNCIVSNLPAEKRKHVTGKFHENSQMILGCENIETRDPGSYHCHACDITFSETEQVHRHVRETAHLNSVSRKPLETETNLKEVSRNVFNYYILKVNEDDYRCIVCNVDISASATSVDRHVTSKAHADAIVKYSGRNLTKTGNDVYFCGVCRFSIHGLRQVYSHITEEEHSHLVKSAVFSSPLTGAAAQNSAKIDSLKKAHIRLEEMNRQPTIQKQQLSSKEEGKQEIPKDAARSVSTRTPLVGSQMQGLQAQKLNFEKYSKESTPKDLSKIISTTSSLGGPQARLLRSPAKQEAQQLNSKNESDEEIPKEIPQMAISTKSPPVRSQAQALQTPAKSADGNETKEKLSVEEDKLLKNYIVKAWDKIYFCFLCECQVFPSDGNCDGHVSGSFHKEAVRKYGCDQINFVNGTHRCACCNLDMSDFQAVCLHIKEKSHVDRLELLNNNKSTTVLKPKTNREVNDILYYVTVFEERRAFCEICECHLALNHVNITTHISGKPHKTALRAFGCQNVAKLADSTYICKCCDYFTENLADVFVHVKNPRHLNLANKQSRIIHRKPKKTTKSNITPNSENLANTTPVKTTSPPENAKTFSPMEKSSFLYSNYIVAMERKLYFCHCCNCEISGEQNFYSHATGKKHHAALVKYTSQES